MSLEELSKFTITQKYSKYIPELQRRETWEEIVDRSLTMHMKKFDNLEPEDKKELEEAFNAVKLKHILPSMRGMQFAGPAVEAKNERQYNCAFLHIHNTRCIEKAFYLLLCGVGCGFGLMPKWVSQFPKLEQKKRAVKHYVIEDSIEGWATSTKVLIDSYLEGNEYSGYTIVFDYSRIRPKGAPISHGGVAPGPEGLKLAHKRIEDLLQSRQTEFLTSLDIYDTLMHVADAVLSGGIRRAACIALFDKSDVLMMSSKSDLEITDYVGNPIAGIYYGKVKYNNQWINVTLDADEYLKLVNHNKVSWFKIQPQRARSNNTCLLKRDELDQETITEMVNHTRQYGEPGFAFVNDLDTGLNPCAEISFLPFVGDTPAVGFCNLTTINGTKVRTEEDLRKAIRLATIIGTVQAAYTDFKFLDEEDRLLAQEEALLGVSILGFMSNPKVLLDGDVLERGAEYAIEVNKEWASKIGINPAARVTCVKPDGNSSCVLESAFSGVHPAHAPVYLRRVQVNKSDPVYKHFKEKNEMLCEESIFSATKTDDIVTFPIVVESPSAIVKDDLSALEHLEYIKTVQQRWVTPGSKNSKRDVSHAVSCTVLVKPEEWDEVTQYLYDNRNYFTNVSFLPFTGDKLYLQAPYEKMESPEDMEKWCTLRDYLEPVDYSTMHEESDNTKLSEEVACVGGVCQL